MSFNEKYWIAGGLGTKDGLSEANAWDTATLITSAAAGDRVNMKASTDANTTTARTFANAGTTLAPIWFRGYKSTIGDMDATPTTNHVAGTDIPSITFTTAAMTISGAHQHWSNIAISGARTAGAQLVVSGGLQRMDRCRVTNTGANAASSAVITQTNNFDQFTNCYFNATSTATRIIQCAAASHFAGCVFTGGGIGLDISSNNTSAFGCAFRSCGSNGIKWSVASQLIVILCTFANCGGDAILIATVPTWSTIGCCLFTGTTGWGINNSSGANTNFVQRFCNKFDNNSSGTETGFGDAPTYHDQSDSVTAIVSATDLSLIGGSIARAAAMGLFENEAYTSYLSMGAVQPNPAGGGCAFPFSGGQILGI